MRRAGPDAGEAHGLHTRVLQDADRGNGVERRGRVGHDGEDRVGTRGVAGEVAHEGGVVARVRQLRVVDDERRVGLVEEVHPALAPLIKERRRADGGHVEGGGGADGHGQIRRVRDDGRRGRLVDEGRVRHAEEFLAVVRVRAELRDGLVVEKPAAVGDAHGEVRHVVQVVERRHGGRHAVGHTRADDALRVARMHHIVVAAPVLQQAPVGPALRGQARRLAHRPMVRHRAIGQADGPEVRPGVQADAAPARQDAHRRGVEPAARQDNRRVERDEVSVRQARGRVQFQQPRDRAAADAQGSRAIREQIDLGRAQIRHERLVAGEVRQHATHDLHTRCTGEVRHSEAAGVFITAQEDPRVGRRDAAAVVARLRRRVDGDEVVRGERAHLEGLQVQRAHREGRIRADQAAEGIRDPHRVGSGIALRHRGEGVGGARRAGDVRAVLLPLVGQRERARRIHREARRLRRQHRDIDRLLRDERHGGRGDEGRVRVAERLIPRTELRAALMVEIPAAQRHAHGDARHVVQVRKRRDRRRRAGGHHCPRDGRAAPDIDDADFRPDILRHAPIGPALGLRPGGDAHRAQRRHGAGGQADVIDGRAVVEDDAIPARKNADRGGSPGERDAGREGGGPAIGHPGGSVQFEERVHRATAGDNGSRAVREQVNRLRVQVRHQPVADHAQTHATGQVRPADACGRCITCEKDLRAADGDATAVVTRERVHLDGERVVRGERGDLEVLCRRGHAEEAGGEGEPDPGVKKSQPRQGAGEDRFVWVHTSFRFYLTLKTSNKAPNGSDTTPELPSAKSEYP